MLERLVDNSTLVKLRALVGDASKIVITCHLSPDGDAIGSSLALCRVLRNMGKRAEVVTPDMVPRALNFVPNVKEVTAFTINEGRARMLVSRADLIFCLDYNTIHRIDRLGECIEKSHAPRILLDHHLDPDNAFDVIVSHPQLSSTCEIVYRVIKELGWTVYVDKLVAQCIYLGMMTDTGNFTYSSDYPAVYEILAELVSYNIEKQWLYNMAMNTFSADCLRLQGYAIAHKMQLFPEKEAALITLTRDELTQFNYKRGDTEGLVNKPLAIPGVTWVVFFREDPEYIKVSTRSVGDFSVSDICNDHFNGGGHKNAAGGEFYGTMDEAVAEFMKVLDEVELIKE